jgi:DNA modification methylase
LNEYNKIILGDCLEKIKDIDDESVDLAIIDPPYGKVVNDDWDKGENPFTLELINETFRVLKPTGSFYIWCGIGEKSQSLIDFFNLMKESKFRITYQTRCCNIRLFFRKRYNSHCYN